MGGLRIIRSPGRVGKVASTFQQRKRVPGKIVCLFEEKNLCAEKKSVCFFENFLGAEKKMFVLRFSTEN